MLFFTLFILLSASCLAVPANHLDARQEGDQTFTITCLGPKCTDYPPTTRPGGEPTTTPRVTTTPTKKPTTTRRFTPPPETYSEDPYPTRTRKSTQQPTKTQDGEVGPSSTRCPVPLYYQCGGYYDGKPWDGCTECESGAKCIWQNDFYYQCVAK